ncbi:DUF1830 domain-containing protein [Geminocystis sp.]|uniref:DUF1830 domain-containing protein n=1 Tax=Geminocystis sp. TaxID=2664100 RepID=UPI0035943F38
MAQILDAIPHNENDAILCCYVNATNQIQIARITNISNWYFERVVFPGQRLIFEALPEALLEIHSGMMASAILSDTIPCKRLCVHESENDEQQEENQTNIDNKEENTISSDLEAIIA